MANESRKKVWYTRYLGIKPLYGPVRYNKLLNIYGPGFGYALKLALSNTIKRDFSYTEDFFNIFNYILLLPNLTKVLLVSSIVGLNILPDKIKNARNSSDTNSRNNYLSSIDDTMSLGSAAVFLLDAAYKAVLLPVISLKHLTKNILRGVTSLFNKTKKKNSNQNRPRINDTSSSSHGLIQSKLDPNGYNRHHSIDALPAPIPVTDLGHIYFSMFNLSKKSSVSQANKNIENENIGNKNNKRRRTI